MNNHLLRIKIFAIALAIFLSFLGGVSAARLEITDVNEYSIKVQHHNMEYEHNWKYCPYCGERIEDDK